MRDIYRLLAEQRISEYDLRLRHVDELLAQAEKRLNHTPGEADISAELEKLMEERDRLAAWLDETRKRPLENWREDSISSAGPMGIWDAVAQQVERLVERIER
ncbi:hypothetical protein [Candidatus Ferrigenium straubiae]|jgi:hypothetical protein|uniref:hypothetical protein n=1 Tax=Candidatus Ferrigenium straubiae TaxID=2919506 RepID=UPI003F4AD9DA